MFDFREEVKKVEEEGVVNGEHDLKKQTEFLLNCVLDALKLEKYMFGFICTKTLVFANVGEAIHVKASENHSTDLLQLRNTNSSRIFKAIKAKMRVEKFQICNESENSFTINLD